VFGASGGIGSALVKRLASKGRASALVLSDINDDKLQQLKRDFDGKGAAVDALAADAQSAEEVEKVIAHVMKTHGRLDGVANCAGNVVSKSAVATHLDDLEQVLRTNLYTSFNIVHASIKAMLAEQHGGPTGGAVALVSAAVASHGIPNFSAMSAAKAGVEGLARSAAATYAKRHIRVNCVAPGLTATGQTEYIRDKDQVSHTSAEMHPLKAFATPDHIASALDFLLHPENNFITGQVLAVDGGLTTLHPSGAGDKGM
jgi:NAD(P)-dependent dehydrogenase (short-subunit alcohol dehydrogenase family)